MQCNTEKPFPEVSIQGRCEDISKEGHTVSNRGYSPDYHVDLHAVLIKGLQRGGGGGVTGRTSPQDPLPPKYVPAMQLRPDKCGFTLYEK